MPSKRKSYRMADDRKVDQACRRKALKPVMDLDKFLARNGNVKRYAGVNVRVKTVKQMNRRTQ